MPSVEAYLGQLQAHLDEAVRTHRVPGAVCGVLSGDECVVAASGIANLATGIEMTPDTLFQLGSVSKLYTATLVMQMVDAGLVELDEPVRGVLHEFRVADDTATFSITPRQLLDHTSGVEGDHLIDCGRNPDALWRYVSTLDEIGQVHPPEELYSYCNSGYAVAGRIVEEVTGDHFDRALRKRLIRPLGLARTVARAEQAIVHRVAAGHRQAPQGEAETQPWTLARFTIPMAGLMAPAEDVLRFARMHLTKGKGPEGRQVLAARRVAQMQEPGAEMPGGGGRGLGFELQRWGDVDVIGHDGDTVGQRAYLRILPARDAAVVVLVNSFVGGLVARDVLRAVAADLFELDVPALPPADPAVDVDPTRYTGIFERLHQRMAVAGEGTSGLAMTIIPDEVFRLGGLSERTLRLEPTAPDEFRTVDPQTGLDVLVHFVDTDDEDAGGSGRPTYLHYAGRAHRRIS